MLISRRIRLRDGASPLRGIRDLDLSTDRLLLRRINRFNVNRRPAERDAAIEHIPCRSNNNVRFKLKFDSTMADLKADPRLFLWPGRQRLA